MEPHEAAVAGFAAMPFGSIIGAAHNVVGELVTELSSFTKFRDRIDELLTDLKASSAAPNKLGEDPVGKAEFGDPSWAEAAGLYTTYNTVITELETLSKLLSDSIEGMGIAVLASHNGYENLDIDIRRRMLAISEDATEHYGGAYDPSKQDGKPTPAPTSTESTGDGI
ncbi:hypothetical protein OG413_16470 [Streptomyces sp. NBC_01433]|uniref:hypothetical protein n=1 Tax=Streptomyces sp. NBC_01433 TaxID=2903864 RepID=UPI002257D1FB|nr:hypothetical protein [Streptomyces sp. NBC_01433]MCX4676878.1 hypothetical protein [Streptomyces sp. NBC_01433]